MSLGGLDRCACKRGFFTLRDCENAAGSTCSICARRVCDEHLAPRVDAKVCVECAARQAEEQAAGAPGAPGAPAAAGPTTPTETAVRWRTAYYRQRDYSPMWWATYDPYWDNWGYRWYDDDRYDDDDGGGFGDS